MSIIVHWIRFYQAGLVLRRMHCNGEFCGMMEKVEDKLDVDKHSTGAQDHVPEAEQNHGTIKERIGAAHHCLPYKAIPHIMIRYLAMIQANQLNLLPVKGGVSPYYSPSMILSLDKSGLH
jgi:hypothetical protein